MYTIVVDFHTDTRTPKEAAKLAERLARKAKRRGLQCYKRDTRVIFRPALLRDVMGVLEGYDDYRVATLDVAAAPQ